MSGKRTCAIIVTFEPSTEGLVKTLFALAAQVEGIAIVDNGSRHFDESHLREAHPSLVVKKLEINKGIGAAQNAGMALARELGYQYVLLLDQDSVPQEGMVANLRAVLERMSAEGHKVACVGPRVRFGEDSSLSRFAKLGWGTLRFGSCRGASSAVECDTLISSGSLIPLAAIEEIGGMEEDLFIDQVDTEWCLRAGSRGYQIFGACDAILDHRLGESVSRFWMGRWRRLSRHRPFRYYYIFRNTILLFGRDYVSVKWILVNLRWLTALFIVYGVFARNRSGELGMMMRGMRDGIRGVTGRIVVP